MVNILQISVLILWLFSFQGKNQNAILGVWHTPNKDGKVRIYKVDNRYFGKLISYTTPGETDRNNPDPALRSRNVVGMNIFQDFVYDEKAQRWVNGTVYDPESGKSYSCSLWIDEENPMKLMARGYVMGMVFLGRTETFKRAR